MDLLARQIATPHANNLTSLRWLTLVQGPPTMLSHASVNRPHLQIYKLSISSNSSQSIFLNSHNNITHRLPSVSQQTQFTPSHTITLPVPVWTCSNAQLLPPTQTIGLALAEFDPGHSHNAQPCIGQSASPPTIYKLSTHTNFSSLT